MGLYFWIYWEVYFIIFGLGLEDRIVDGKFKYNVIMNWGFGKFLW